jgi:triacylglycerol lipase
MDPVSVSPSSPSPSRETPEEKRQRERLADDHLVKSSADSLSVVFDWLIERVPAPEYILGRSSTTADSTTTSKVANANATLNDKEMSAAAVLLTAGPSFSPSTPSHEPGAPSAAAPPSEMKRLMEKEDKGRKKNELASKDDLERFYIALSRKMYDEGL